MNEEAKVRVGPQRQKKKKLKETSPVKEVPPLFLTIHYSFNKRESKFQNGHYRNESTDPR
jgi:hypothetical protein